MLNPDIAFSLICQTLGNSGKQCLNLGGGSPKLGRNLGTKYDHSFFEPGWSPGSARKNLNGLPSFCKSRPKKSFCRQLTFFLMVLNSPVSSWVKRLCKSATVIYLIFMRANPNNNHPHSFAL